MNTVRFMASAIALAALVAGCAALAPGAGTKPPVTPPAEAPFATVLAVESVQLEQPVPFRQGGQIVPIRDVIVVYLHPANATRFVPKSIETPTVLLEDSPTLSLYPPMQPVWAIVAPRPTIALRDATLWVAPTGSDPTSKQRSELVALRRSAQRAHAGDVISLARVPAAASAAPTVAVRDNAALLAHALERAKALAPKAR